jgi:hypothetical protein
MTLFSFLEQAFSVLFRLPELWLETWWRIIRRPFKAPLVLAFSTRRSFDCALSSPIFFLINIILFYILNSTLPEGLIRFAHWQRINLDARKFFNLEDVNAIRLLVLVIVSTSVATFSYIMLARVLGIRSKLARLLSTTLIYYWSVQFAIVLMLLLGLYALHLFPSIDQIYNSILLTILLAVAASASLLIWVFGALMLVRASPLNKIIGWKRFILRTAVTISLVLMFIGIYYLSSQIYIKGPIEKTVDIVDGECNIEHGGLRIEALVHNSSTNMYKINSISVEVGPVGTPSPDSPEIWVYKIPNPMYLKPDATETIKTDVLTSEFLNRMISKGGALECSYQLDLELPSGYFRKNEVWLPKPK